jgi:hypothetical protein
VGEVSREINVSQTSVMKRDADFFTYQILTFISGLLIINKK